jgi:hypothetical protein
VVLQVIYQWLFCFCAKITSWDMAGDGQRWGIPYPFAGITKRNQFYNYKTAYIISGPIYVKFSGAQKGNRIMFRAPNTTRLLIFCVIDNVDLPKYYLWIVVVASNILP